jgi:hypothetical protein
MVPEGGNRSHLCAAALTDSRIWAGRSHRDVRKGFAGAGAVRRANFFGMMNSFLQKLYHE